MKSYHTPFQAIVAQYKHFLSSVFFGHSIICNLLIHFLLIKLWINYTFLAQRTCNFPILIVLGKTYCMHGMTTLQDRQTSNGWLHIIHAHGAVLFQFLRNTRVVVFLIKGVAAFAYLAVEWIFFPANSAYSALITMIYLLFFVLVVKQDADFTEIPCEFNLTFFTVFLRLLDMLTILTLYFFNFMSF